jgi:hypothetical protein
MEDENELYGLESEYFPEEEVAEEEESVSGLSSLPATGALRSELFQRLLEREKRASETEDKDFNTVLSTIEQAKQRLLAKPSKGEELRNIAMRLAQPRKQTDPRFFERRNLYTFLRDIGEYGGEQAEARKEAEAKALQLDQLAAKYRMERAQKEGTQARQLMAQYFKEPKEQGETARTRALREEAALRGITVPELLKLKDEEKKKGKEDKGLTIPELRSIRVDVAATLDGPKERLTTINEGLSNLGLAIKGNSQAESQLNRALASISGDKQLSMAEVESIVGAGSFAQRVGNAISKFFTGGAGDLTNEQKKELLETYEAYHANRYNSARNRLKRIYSGFEGIPEDTFDAPYVSVADKRRREAEEEARRKADQEKSEPAGITLSTQKTVRPVD